MGEIDILRKLLEDTIREKKAKIDDNGSFRDANIQRMYDKLCGKVKRGNNR